MDRRLGPVDAAAIVVSNVIGGGIFITPVIVAGLVTEPRAMLGVWLAGGLLAFAGAMAYAELAAVRPRAGGEYIYLRDAFGPLAAFLTGWTSFIAGFSGAIAANAVGLASYLGRFVPAAADTTPFLTIPLPLVPLVVSPQAIVALAAIAALTAVHIRGLGPGRLVQNALAGVKVAALVAFIAFGFTLGRGTMAHVTGGEGASATGWLLSLVPVMFAYSGWNAAVYVAEEVRNPGRNVPLALASGTATVIAIYLALNLLYLYAMPIGELAGLKVGVVDATAERLFGFAIANLLAAFTIISIAASISAMTLAGPRVYYAMAQDGLFLRSAARVHPRYHTPAIAIIAQGVWASVLVLCGTLSELVQYTGFAVILFAGIAVFALFVLRRREQRDGRHFQSEEPGGSTKPFRTWGYPVTPGIFVLASFVILANEIWRNPGPSAAGLAIIAAGIPIYFAARRRA
ncbi:MAG: amino acid permease [Acidobacteria bacterium]|nr:amino acid permease [Acidobacteriota bacterium]